MAELADVGLTWYTWLEQGRGIRPSARVLTAISQALQLEPAERQHIFRLAGVEPPPAATSECVSARLRRTLECWEPFPAHVAGRRGEVLAWNRPSEQLFCWSELPEGRRNSLWLVFMRPTCSFAVDSREHELKLMVASFRAEAGRDLADPDYQELIGDLLRGSPEFAAIWDRQDVRGRPEGLKSLDHPVFGRLDLEFTTYRVGEQPGLKLVLYAPLRGSATAAKLRQADQRLASAAQPTA